MLQNLGVIYRIFTISSQTRNNLSTACLGLFFDHYAPIFIDKPSKPPLIREASGARVRSLHIQKTKEITAWSSPLLRAETEI